MTAETKRGRTLGELDLNLLVALDALLREQNVTRAGVRIGLSQPTMSGALRRLRRFFDDELLVRVGRDLELTAVGRDLVEPVQEILLLIQRAIDGPGVFDPSSAERTFRVLASDYSQFVLQGVVRRLAEEAPGIRIRFQSPDERTLRLLQNRQVDLAVMSRLGEMPSQRLYDDQWVCAVADDHPDIGERLTKKQFLALPHVAFAFGRRGRSGVEQHLAAAGIVRNIVVTTDSFTASLYMLAGTRMIAIVQRRLGELLQDQTGVRLFPMPVAVPDLVSRLWWHPIDSDDQAHTYVRSVMVDVARAG